MDGWMVGLREVQKLQSTNSIFVEQSRKPSWCPSGKAVRWESRMSGGDGSKQNVTWERTGKCPRMTREPGKIVCMECSGPEFPEAINPNIQGMGSWSKVRGVCSWGISTETEVTLSVDPYSPPIWEGLRVELNTLSEQTPRLTLTLILKLMSGVWSELGRVVEMLKVSINLLSATVTAPSFYFPQPLHQLPHPGHKGLWLGDRFKFASGSGICWSSDTRWVLGRRWQRGPDYVLIPEGWDTGHRISAEEP